MNSNTFLQDLAVVMMVAGLVTVILHQFKQPVVLGYILAGLIIGPHTPPFALIHDQNSIRTLADLGVILLMFTLGLQFNLRTLRNLGATAFVAASIEILTMVWLGYQIGRLFGWSKMDALFLGAMLCITSTTIIIKTFGELGLLKEPFAKMVTGISLMEDMIGITLTAVLSGIAMTGTLELHAVGQTAGKAVIFLSTVLVVGLLFVPPLFRYIARFKSAETLLVVALGLCFGTSLLALNLGFSIALGAFLIGVIIGEARESGQLNVLMEPLRDMFIAVFFVSVGLMINPRLLLDYLVPTLVVSAAVIAGKMLSFTFGTLAAGNSLRNSLRVGTSLLPIGELSLIIAALGVSLNVTSDFLYPIAVCVSAITMLATPYLIRHSDSLINWVERILPARVTDYLELYGRWTQRLAAGQSSNLARQLARKWVWQMGLNIALVTGLFLVATALADRVTSWWPSAPTWIGGARGVMWIGIGLLALPCLIATVRKLQALAMLLAEISVTPALAGKNTTAIRGLITNVVLIAGTAVLVLWLLVVSAPILPPWPWLLVPLAIVALLTVVFWRRFIQIHAKAQFSLRETLAQSPALPEETAQPLSTILQNAQLEVSVIADGSRSVGRLIRELELRTTTGASIVAIERAGTNLVNPGPDEELRAGDRLFLLGTRDQIAQARAVLQTRV
ncbi:MAG: Glutathione-regulated potassium-efflux system protein KefB [Verrucomicrobiae bacterium]|nr:Glutathione-regulated potassium-efflux system protein KefB [Verrucomicrobiae bacterium]